MNEQYESIIRLAQRVIHGGDVTEEEARQIIDARDEDTMIVLAMADKIRQHFSGSAVDVCAIINARSGRCPEDCKFCAQSAHYHTGAAAYDALPEEEIIRAACKAKEAGAKRFSLVTAGRDQRNFHDFDTFVRLVCRIRQKAGIDVCCSLGFLTREQALRLKEAGVSRLHCNVETAPSYFPHICTTHTIEDKIRNVRIAQEAGIRVCSGGIIGLGETPEQRVEMAFFLKKLHIDSIPLNILNPVAGTPFANNKRLAPLEILRSFAMFRFVLPRAQIRTAGGREVNLRSLQPLALAGGLDGLMIGNYLTTQGSEPASDARMLQDLGRMGNCAAGK